MNIFKSFEIFLREPLSILRDRIVQIVNINSPYSSKASVDVDLLDKKAQITVVNSDKMYHLLRTVVHKRESQAVERLQLPAKGNRVVLGQLCKRV